MTTAATSLLGLALPVTGELAGTWGDTVNNSITSLLDSAVAGTTTLSTDGDVTLTTTTLAANQARQAILLCSGARTALRTITAPAQSKIYTIINATTGGYSVKLVGVGPTTGVTIVAGESAVCAWNGSDFIKISNTGGSASFTNVTVSGTTTLSGLTASTALALNSSKEVVSVTNTGTGNNVLSASPTLTGTIGAAALTLSSDLTLSGGTANGVLYLNGSKVATSGSALTFDGTTLSVVDSSSPRFSVNGSSTATGYLIYKNTTSGLNRGYVGYDFANDAMPFAVGGTEGMRLTSTGLGIGTSSPTASAKLELVGGNLRVRNTNNTASSNTTFWNGDYVGEFLWNQSNTSGAVAGIQFVNGSSANGNAGIGGVAEASSPTTSALAFYTGGSGVGGGTVPERMRLDSSGNLGLGTTSPNLSGGSSGSQVITVSASSSGRNGILELNGTRTTSGDYVGYVRFFNNAAATPLADIQAIRGSSDTTGVLAFATSGSERARIDSSGNFGIGTTSPDAPLAFSTAVGKKINLYALSDYSMGVQSSEFRFASSGVFTFYTSGYSGTERARIDSDGNLLVGVNSAYNTTRKLQVANGMAIGYGLYTFAALDTNSLGDLILSSNANPANTGSNSNIVFKLGTSGGGGPSEVARFISTGNFGVGNGVQANVNYQFGSGLTDGFGTIPNCTIEKRLGVSASADSPVLSLGYYSSGYGMDLWVGTTGLSPGYIDIRTNEALIFRKQTNTGSATETMRITSGGNLTVGATASYGRIGAVQAGKGTIAGLDTTSYAAGVGATLDLGGNYRASNDYSTFVRIAAEKANATNGDYGYNMGFYVTTNNGATFGTKAMTITSDGYVGIGTASPSKLLQVTTNSTAKTEVLFLQSASGFAAGAGTFIRAGSGGNNSVVFGFDYDSSSFQVQGGLTGSAIMSVSNSGSVGIGTTSPTFSTSFSATNSALLQVGNETYAHGQLRVGGNTSSAIGLTLNYDNGGATTSVIRAEYGSTSANAALYIDSGFVAFRTGTSFTERARIDGSGNLLVGTTSVPTNGASGSGAATLNGAINCDGIRSHAGTGGAYQGNNFNFQWTGSPALWVDTTNLGNIQLSSDYRIKKNIKTQTISAIDRVLRLRPVTYEIADYGDLFKADDIQREGFIAHEVQEVIPSGAEGEKDEEGRIQNLRVDAILSVVVKAMQEQQALIQQLTARVAQLESN